MMNLCPRCGATEMKMVSMSYPTAYECDTCGYGFVRMPNALIDE